MDADIFVSGKKKLRIQKYPDTCGRGLIEVDGVRTGQTFWRVFQWLSSQLVVCCGTYVVWRQDLKNFRPKNDVKRLVFFCGFPKILNSVLVSVFHVYERLLSFSFAI